MEVTLFCSKRQVRTAVSRQLSWYDHIQKKMLHFSGGDLQFIYNVKEKRCLPKVIPMYQNTYGSNYAQIKTWIEANQREYDIDIVSDHPDKYVVIEIPDNVQDEVSRSLYISRIYNSADS